MEITGFEPATPSLQSGRATLLTCAAPTGGPLTWELSPRSSRLFLAFPLEAAADLLLTFG